MILKNATFGDPTVYKSLPHLTDEINKLSEHNQKKISSLIDRKNYAILVFLKELKSTSTLNFVHKHLRDEIIKDFDNLDIPSKDAKTLATNFLLTKLKIEFLKQ